MVFERILQGHGGRYTEWWCHLAVQARRDGYLCHFLVDFKTFDVNPTCH